MTEVDLSTYDNSWYDPGPTWKRILWLLCNSFFFNHRLAGFSTIKCLLLRAFGAQVGNNVILKPSVNIKYPWFLSIGNNVWIGENVWIDNLTKIIIGNNVCLSQGSMLLTGNHNYKSSKFDLVIKKIVLEDGVWIGAKAVVCPGVICKKLSVLSVSSVANTNLESNSVYSGNPAVFVRKRLE